MTYKIHTLLLNRVHCTLPTYIYELHSIEQTINDFGHAGSTGAKLQAQRLHIVTVLLEWELLKFCSWDKLLCRIQTLPLNNSGLVIVNELNSSLKSAAKTYFLTTAESSSIELLSANYLHQVFLQCYFGTETTILFAVVPHKVEWTAPYIIHKVFSHIVA